MRGATLIGPGRGPTTDGQAALGAGHTSLPQRAVQPATSAGHVPRPISLLHNTIEHARVRE